LARTAGIIVAAGRGERMGSSLNKVYLPIGDRPILLHSIEAFEASIDLDLYVVVTSPAEVNFCRTLLSSYNLLKLADIVPGGAVRQDSVAAGLSALPPDCELVAIHDGARPLITAQVLSGAIRRAAWCGAVVVSVPVKDTIKVVGDEQLISSTPVREALWSAQTPQVFNRLLLERAHREADLDGFTGTDDASLVERLGLPVEVYQGQYDNIKVTTQDDLLVASTLLERRQDRQMPKAHDRWPRTGFGYDVHQFAEGRPLKLGGVEIPGAQGLAGHSDADVALHALMDACLGAAGLDDIGHYFPPADECWRDADSLALLTVVRDKVAATEFLVYQVDVVIAAERPHLAPYLDRMKERIGSVLGIPTTATGIQATTSENLGFVGRGEGMASWAVATLIPMRL
jgi:2-C-methyl-D-erythritol 4-phosphate cytidylyltransferase/2-C-methyl-D-erythritol 2,4-cyclodiphosphate synthase